MSVEVILSILITIFSQLGDYLTTRQALALGGKEANPFMKSIVSNVPLFILIKTAVAVAVSLVGILVSPWIPLGLAVIMCFVIQNNLNAIKKLKKNL